MKDYKNWFVSTLEDVLCIGIAGRSNEDWLRVLLHGHRNGCVHPRNHFKR